MIPTDIFTRRFYRDFYPAFCQQKAFFLFLLKQAQGSLLQKKLRSTLSTLGIFFGVVAVLAMLSIGEGAKQETLQQLEQLGTRSIILRQAQLSESQYQQVKANLSEGLTKQDMEILRATLPLEGIAALKHVEASLAQRGTQAPFEILAATESLLKVKGLSLLQGRFLTATDIAKKQQVCVIGEEVFHSLKAGGQLGATLRIHDKEFLIVGILKGYRSIKGSSPQLQTRNLNQSILIPLGTEQGVIKLPSLRNEMLSELILQLKKGESMENASLLIKRVLEVAHRGIEDYQLIIPKALIDQALKTQRTFNLILASIAAISLLVGGIGIMNIMLANVSERTREIGIRRAVGANFKHIIAQFLAESLLLTLIGASLGVLAGIAFTWAISFLAGWKTVITFWAIFSSVTMACSVGLFSGLYPAIQAANMNPIRALRHD